MFKAFTNELKYYDLFHKDKNYAEEAKNLPLKGKTVLEIGSGTGLMTRELEKLGFKVTTVDPNSDADYSGIEDIPYNKSDFDNIVALYDVGNYMFPFEWHILKKAFVFKKVPFIYEIWDATKLVKPFTYKKVENCRRIRLGLKFRKKAHLLFIFWGKGPVISYHKLYLHEN